MPVYVDVLRNGQIVLFRNVGDLAVRELLDSMELFQRMCNRATYPVHMVADTTEVNKFPFSIINYTTQRRISPLYHPNAGTFFVVINKPRLNKIVEVANRLVPTAKVLAVATVKEALQTLDALLISTS